MSKEDRSRLAVANNSIFNRNGVEYCEAQNLVAELAVVQQPFTCFVSELGRGFAHKSLTLPSSIYILLPPEYPNFLHSTKVLYATQFLAGEIARVFEYLEKLKGLDRILWKSYRIFLQDLL